MNGNPPSCSSLQPSIFVDGWLEQETSEGIAYAAYNADQKPLGLTVTLLNNDNGVAQ